MVGTCWMFVYVVLIYVCVFASCLYLLFLCGCMFAEKSTVATVCPCGAHVLCRLYISHAVGAWVVHVVRGWYIWVLLGTCFCSVSSVMLYVSMCCSFCFFTCSSVLSLLYFIGFANLFFIFTSRNSHRTDRATYMRMGRGLQPLRPCDRRCGDASNGDDHATRQVRCLQPRATTMRQERADASNQERCLQS